MASVFVLLIASSSVREADQKLAIKKLAMKPLNMPQES